MTINPVTGLLNGASSNLQKTAVRVQTTIAQLVGGERITKAGDDVSSLSVATLLQNQVGSLKQANNNIAQALSLSQVTQDSIARQIEIVDRLQQLAAQANNGILDDNLRRGLDTEFQSLVKELNRIGNSAQFNGQKLLDGSLSLSVGDALGGESEEQATALKPGELRAETLLEGKTLNVLTQEAAQQSVEVLQKAQTTLQTSQAGAGSFVESLDFISASLQSAIFNQDAALSTLFDTDFSETASELSLLNVKQDAQLAVLAQSNKLPGSVLGLLSDE